MAQVEGLEASDEEPSHAFSLARSLWTEVFHIVEKFFDVGTARGQVVPTVAAPSIVQPTGEEGIELVTRSADEPRVFAGNPRGSAGILRWVNRCPNRSSHEPAGRAGGVFNVPVGLSVRLVAWTIAARRSRRDSFWLPWLTKAYLSTSRRVRTGITSTFPR